ncbi:LytTR family DNA-binding domain-containing protein [Hymenobacter terrenus]|uniref:LytTR family DNA-binding domain-containing protein n=1 Tax=Hymenobacter terrenus TaxID=1629124 RepID=UPI000619B090|nr:LytTR family DNA-binding domain-containing protein [Hymenobacter terrenus]
MNAPTSFAFIKADKKIIKIKFLDIATITGLGNYVQILMVDGHKHIYYKTLKKLIDNLPAEFMRIHNSCIVNLLNVESVEDNHVRVGGADIAVGKSYRQCLAASLAKRML